MASKTQSKAKDPVDLPANVKALIRERFGTAAAAWFVLGNDENAGPAKQEFAPSAALQNIVDAKKLLPKPNTQYGPFKLFIDHRRADITAVKAAHPDNKKINFMTIAKACYEAVPAGMTALYTFLADAIDKAQQATRYKNAKAAAATPPPPAVVWNGVDEKFCNPDTAEGLHKLVKVLELLRADSIQFQPHTTDGLLDAAEAACAGDDAGTTECARLLKLKAPVPFTRNDREFHKDLKATRPGKYWPKEELDAAWNEASKDPDVEKYWTEEAARRKAACDPDAAAAAVKAKPPFHELDIFVKAVRAQTAHDHPKVDKTNADLLDTLSKVKWLTMTADSPVVTEFKNMAKHANAAAVAVARVEAAEEAKFFEDQAEAGKRAQTAARERANK